MAQEELKSFLRRHFATSVWPVGAGSDVSCAGQANPGGLRRLGGGEGGLPVFDNPRVTEQGLLAAISLRPRRALRQAKGTHSVKTTIDASL